MKERFVIVYGTLTKGCRNHNRFEFDRYTQLIGKLKLKGFKLYKTCSSFFCLPFVMISPNDSISCELYSYKNNDVANTIRAMEVGAGYKEHEVEVLVDNKKIKAVIYIFEELPTKAVEIQSGKWTE